MNIDMVTITMPPTLGMAIGTMMSEPRPEDVSTGIRARIVVAVVIKQGRQRRRPASTVASRASAASQDLVEASRGDK